MIKAYTGFALAFLILLSACAGDVPAQPGTGRKFTAANETYQRVWQAAMAAAGRNFSVEHSSEAGGVIRGHAPGVEEIAIYIRQSRTQAGDTEIEVAGGKKKGLTITSSFYKSPKAKNWPNILFKEISYELENMDRLDALAAAPRASSLRLEDMSPEMRAASENRIRTDIRSQIRAEVRAQMLQEMRNQGQHPVRQPAQQYAPAPQYAPAQQAPAVRRYTGRLAPSRAPLSSQAPATAPVPAASPTYPVMAIPAPALAVVPPLPQTTLSLRERLRELKKLYQDQLISKPEYEVKKAELLADL